MSTFASIQDLEKEAERRVPKPFFDYLQNGAFTQRTMAANRADLDAVILTERVLAGADSQDTSCTVVGQPARLPIVLAPVGLTGMFRGRGEILAAEAARDHGVPYCLSTFSIAAIEDVAEAVGGDFWFQLYPLNDDGHNQQLLDRAAAAGCPVLLVTIDAQIEGTRYSDVHNGLGVPPKLTVGNVVAMLSHPAWLAHEVRSPHYTFGNMIGLAPSGNLDDLAEYVKGALRRSLNGDFLSWVRARWRGKLIVKGILGEEDARVALDAGADAIVVSNHGGRQLEGARSTVRALPAIRAIAPATVEVLADSGIRTGIDVLRMLGLGAHACLIGRAYAYGLAAAGKEGVTTALDILEDELKRTMAMTGVSSVGSLPKELIERSPT